MLHGRTSRRVWTDESTEMHGSVHGFVWAKPWNGTARGITLQPHLMTGLTTRRRSMRNKGLLGVAVIVTVVAVGGIGFAQFTSNASYTGIGYLGTFHLTWTGGTNTGSPGASALETVTCTTPTINGATGYYEATCSANPANTWTICSISFSGNTFTMTEHNLAPGDGCEMPASDGVQLTNTGTLPGTVSLTTGPGLGSCTFASGPPYQAEWWADNVFNTLGGVVTSSVHIGSGGTVPATGGYAVVIWLDPATTCAQGSYFSQTFTIAGASVGT